MATNKRWVIDYPDAATPSGGDLLGVVQTGANKKITLTNLFAWFRGLVNTYTKAQGVTPVALAIVSSSVATDASASNNFTLSMTANATLANPTNLVPGHVYNWVITQDATGSRTLAYGSLFKWPGGIAPVLSVTANAVDTICALYDGTRLIANFAKGYA